MRHREREQRVRKARHARPEGREHLPRLEQHEVAVAAQRRRWVHDVMLAAARDCDSRGRRPYGRPIPLRVLVATGRPAVQSISIGYREFASAGRKPTMRNVVVEMTSPESPT